MAAGFSSSEDEVFSGINITPLVDVVLVLLVIFMMTAPVIYQSAIKIELPKAHSGEASLQSPIQLGITKEGELLWNKQPIDWNALSGKLRDVPNLTDQTAILSADAATPHGTVIRLMDALRTAGLTRFALNVEAQPATAQ